MPKQRVTFTRTETVTVEFDYPVDPFSKSNAEFWINQGYCGASPLGKPGIDAPVAMAITDWKLLRSEPPVAPSISGYNAKPKGRVRK